MPIEKIIMGIDPGTNNMGLGIITASKNELSIVMMDILKLDKVRDHSMKLKMVFKSTLNIIDQYRPDELAIESQFFGKNVQSMLKLGRAQGVAMAAALFRDIPIFEYSPRKIKQSITGKGSASKEQVAGLLSSLLKLNKVPEFFDISDALAVAVCHHFQTSNLSSEKPVTYAGWKSFINDNPGRIIN